MATRRRAMGSRMRRVSGGDARRHRILWGVVLATVVAGVVLGFHYRVGVVVGNSMLPNFTSGEWVWVERRAYRHGLPQRGDVVLARVDGEFVLKRVVALPGERVEVIAGDVWIDGQRTEAAPRWVSGELTIEPGVLGPGCYALLGDNRSLTDRQTLHAVVRLEQILGRVGRGESNR